MVGRMLARKRRRALPARYGHMPAKAARIAEAMKLAPWVDELDDLCLYEVVLQALTARVSAMRHNGDARIIAAGDAALDAVSSGRVTGDQACKKAAVALRKYTRSYGGDVE